MSVLIEDSPRNVGSWIAPSVVAGIAGGAVLTPWATPSLSHAGAGRKPSASARVTSLHNAGVDVWFDPMTHALQMPGVGDFRFYDEYDLWAGARGDLSSQALLEEHVGKVFTCQDTLDVPHLGPTVLLHTGLDFMSVLALEMAREAVRRDPTCWLSIAGTTTFWASGAALDAHIGALNALAPAGWFLTVVRTSTPLPVQVTPEEIHGLCRTARALSDDAPVHVSHGDLAGLPAVAAGAASVGTGWDQRQRVCSITDYGPRIQSDDGFGSWYQRPTIRGLIGSVVPNHATILETTDPALTAHLGGLPAPAVRDTFDHHLSVLTELTELLRAEPDPEQRYHLLLDLYTAAKASWPTVQRITGCPAAGQEWIDGVDQGLRLYGATEGW